MFLRCRPGRAVNSRITPTTATSPAITHLVASVNNHQGSPVKPTEATARKISENSRPITLTWRRSCRVCSAIAHLRLSGTDMDVQVDGAQIRRAGLMHRYFLPQSALPGAEAVDLTGVGGAGDVARDVIRNDHGSLAGAYLDLGGQRRTGRNREVAQVEFALTTVEHVLLLQARLAGRSPGLLAVAGGAVDAGDGQGQRHQREEDAWPDQRLTPAAQRSDQQPDRHHRECGCRNPGPAQLPPSGEDARGGQAGDQ